MVFNLAICIVIRQKAGCLTDAQERIKENKHLSMIQVLEFKTIYGVRNRVGIGL
jgi:hypothetical protein